MGNNWIEWNGGECPVPAGTLVDLRYRSDYYEESNGVPALVFGNCSEEGFWRHDSCGLDIIAWRLHQPEQPAWNGEGLPPVGCECEVKTGKNSWTLCKVVHSSSAGVAFIYLEEPLPELPRKYIGVLDSAPGESAMIYFRPIRTDAERKRDGFIDQLMADWAFLGQDREQAGNLYDAIAAGKFPGVKLD